MSTSVQQHTQAPEKSGLSRFAGLGFVAAFVAAFMAIVTGPELYEAGSLDEYTAALADGARQDIVGATAYILLPLMGALLVWAVVFLATSLDRARGTTSMGGRVAIAGAIIMASGFAIAGAASSAAEHVAAGIEGDFPADASTAYGIDMFASTLMSTSAWGGALVLLGIGVGARRTGALPGWLLWTGIVFAPLLTVAWLFAMVPMLVFLLWIAVTGLIVKRGPVPAA